MGLSKELSAEINNDPIFSVIAAHRRAYRLMEEAYEPVGNAVPPIDRKARRKFDRASSAELKALARALNTVPKTLPGAIDMARFLEEHLRRENESGLVPDLEPTAIALRKLRRALESIYSDQCNA